MCNCLPSRSFAPPEPPPAIPIPPPSAVLPASLLENQEMWAAGANRDIGAIFRLVHQYAGISICRLAYLCEMTPSRVSSYAKGRSRVREQRVIERVADGLGLPGLMLGLAPRPWEGNLSAAPTQRQGVPLRHVPSYGRPRTAA